MEKILNFLAKKKFFLIGLVLSMGLLWPLVAAPYFSHHDDVQPIRVYEMDKCFKDNQIPCRWVPDLGGLYGYPLFNYYGPLPYYTGELFYFLTHNLLISAKLMFALSFLGSYFFMYLLARRLWGELGGSLSAIFYSFAPYHAVDFYVRGAMGEMWALMFFPALLWALFKLFDKPKMGNTLWLAFFTAFLALSHNLSTMIFMPVLLALALLLFYLRKNKRFLWLTLLGLLLGFLLASFYLLPMVFEKGLVHVETTVEGYFSYTEHFKGLKKTILDHSWGWGPSIREVPGGERDGMSYQIGYIHLLGWLLALFAAWKLRRKNKLLVAVVVLSSLVIIGSIFMIHPRSEFVWKLINPIKYLQFPWRFLMFVILFICLIVGSVFEATREKYRVWIWLALVIAAVAFNAAFFRPEKFIYVNDQQLLTGSNWDKQIKRSIFDYLPIYAKAPPAELASDPYQILTGQVEVMNFKKGSDWYDFEADADTHSIIRLSQYYFPNWKIFVDGKQIHVEYTNNSLGLMNFILGKGRHHVRAKLYDTQIRILGNFLTIITVVLLTLLALLQIKKVRVWLEYYRKGIG